MADLFSDVELNPVDESVIVNGSRMDSPPSQRFEICLAGLANICIVDEGEGDKIDGVNLNLTIAHSVPTASLHLGTLPQTERDGDHARQH